MPYASEFVWSLGLLNIHSKEYVDVQLDSTNSSKHCLNLTVGETDSDTVIGYAVGNMTKEIAMKDIRCNTSRWCYTKKCPVIRNILYLLVSISFLHHPLWSIFVANIKIMNQK